MERPARSTARRLKNPPKNFAARYVAGGWRNPPRKPPRRVNWVLVNRSGPASRRTFATLA
jgi:hypothetical protein